MERRSGNILSKGGKSSGTAGQRSVGVSLLGHHEEGGVSCELHERDNQSVNTEYIELRSALGQDKNV